MFTNFSNTSEGLVESKPRPKTNAFNVSCLPCRRKKKKCDIARPICGRCRNSYGQDECTWPDKQRKQRSQYRGAKASQERVIGRSSSSLATSSDTSWELIKSVGSTNMSRTRLPDARMDFGFQDFCSWSLPKAMSEISPYRKLLVLLERQLLKVHSDLSPQAFLHMSVAFQNRILCLPRDFKDSIIERSLPMALEHPPLLHAWVACNVIALSQSTPYWHEMAIKHYDSAVSGLSHDLQRQQADDRWKKETVILLHLFEGFQSKGEESALGKAHLRGLHGLFNPTVKSKKPMNYHEVLLLEAYIMHTTNNYLFESDLDLPIDHITKAADTLTSALARMNMTCNWRNSPWIGFTSPELMDIVYRTSWLSHKAHLDSDDNQEIQNIITRLSSWTASACREESSSSTHLDLPPKRLVLLARAYWCACSYLATSLSHDQDKNTTPPPETKSFVTETLNLLNQLTNYEHTINNHLWPLVVVGTAALDPATQEQITSLLPQFNQALGPESIKRAKRFLATAWKIEDKGSHGEQKIYGRKIFRDREALYHMFF